MLLITACSNDTQPVGKMPPSLTVGKPAPDFIFQTLTDVDGKSVSLKQYQGKVIYLDFWASWCKPCLKSMPQLNKLRSELMTLGFEVVAVNLDNDPENGKIFLAEHPVDYPVVYTSSTDIYKLYQIKVLPTSFIIDKKGILRYAHLGFKDKDIIEIRKQIMLLLVN